MAYVYMPTEMGLDRITSQIRLTLLDVGSCIPSLREGMSGLYGWLLAPRALVAFLLSFLTARFPVEYRSVYCVGAY